jgi:ABC-2 type transport system permease protein
MTATTPAPTRSHASGGGPNFGRLLRSEWIKFRTLRSTFWCTVIIVLLSAGLSALLGAVLPSALERSADATGAPPMDVQSIAVQAIIAPTTFTALIAAVLGALMITGEFGTGMIRSTFAAAPGRLSAVFAKAVVVGLSLLVIAVVSVAVSTLIVVALLDGAGHHVDLGDAGIWQALAGDVLYIVGVALLSFFLGAIIRNSAGGIATALGLVLVLPIIMNVVVGVTGRAAWAANITAILPSEAGGRMYSYLAEGATQPDLVKDGILTLTPVLGGLVLLAWVVVAAIVAAVLIKRRDA